MDENAYIFWCGGLYNTTDRREWLESMKKTAIGDIVEVES